MTLGFQSDETAQVACATSHASGWQIDNRIHTNGIEYTAGGTGWLQASPEGAPAKLKLTTLTANGAGVLREAYVHIRAGVLTRKVRVKQESVIIRFTPASVHLPGIATTAPGYPVTVTCTDSQGNELPNVQWRLTSQASWLKLSDSPNGPRTTSVQGSGAGVVYLFAEQNTSNSASRAVNVMNDGTGLKAFSVTQAPYIAGGGNPIPGKTYVGAFWRADQTGERIINISGVAASAAGAWSAYVLEYGDFKPGDIVFSTANSAAGTAWSALEAIDMSNPINDANYGVAGNDQIVTGMVVSGGDIFFRIGLKSKWSANPAYNATTKPARYAVVMISYNNNTRFQKLYLRQGHEADYLMRKQDNNAAGNLESLTNGTIAEPRPDAKKFSPYNLTAAGYRDGTSSAQYIQLDAGGGVFTNYPSQAGAFFQWADATNVRYAYHPTNPSTGVVSGWQNNYPRTYWDALKATHETCPPGYRRPTDGRTDAADVNGPILSSEMRQSLWQDPAAENRGGNTNNSVWGYYADGFFDRRQIGASNTYANSAVATGSAAAAYIGRLFFNPTTNASLFIPISGYRGSGNGELSHAGGYGGFWSSSSYSAVNSWNLYTYSGSALQNYHGRDYGFPVRCVQE